MTKIVIVGMFIALAACREQPPPAPTDEQSGQLNEAEAMLNEEATNRNGR